MNKLRMYRKQAGLTLKEVGNMVGKSESCICQYEFGAKHPRYPVAKALCKIYGCRLEDIYEIDNDETEG